MDLARDSGSPQATKMVYVLTEASPGHNADLALRPGFVVYLPIYQKGKPLGTVAERRRALQGFIVGSFISDELLDGIFKGSFAPAIDFEVYDGKDPASSSLLYDRDGVLRAREEDEANTLSSPGLYNGGDVIRFRGGAKGPTSLKRAASNWPDTSGACTLLHCLGLRREQRASCPRSCSRAASP
jgi:CHASE domain